MAFSVISCLFIAELILGYNGRLLLIAGIPVRMVMYGLFGVVLILMMMEAVYSRQISLSWKSDNSLWRSFEPFDYALAGFLVLNAVWIFVIPSITGYGVGMALEQTKSTVLLLLYFPLLILIRTGSIRFGGVDRMIKPCLFVLAALHVVFYVGEWIRDDGTFVDRFFETVLSVTRGHSEAPDGVMYTLNYYRIVYPTSLFLLMIFYYTYRDRLTIPNLLFFLAGLTALAVTFAKSLWLGAAAGVVFLVCYHAIHKLGKFNPKKVAAVVLLTMAVGCLLNVTMLDHYLSLRIRHAFAVNTAYETPVVRVVIQEGVNDHLRSLDEWDRSARSNGIRIVQSRVLLEKWRQSPWFGFGYGSYAEEMIRGPKGQPFLYEMLLPSLLVQIGLIGVLIWAAFFGYVFWYAGKKAKASAGVLALVAAIVTASQFNPFILGAPAMSMFLYALLVIRTAEPDAAASDAAGNEARPPAGA
ncbi:MAG: hypothetical protein BAA01_10210 [Bacillus thermozeamaize]|uniref:O-antigen ligase-related domain-containing protein n=1 Tax=Bacillus thermozeamaize TaxID=230954 RepID=A0A1Y3PNP5_9BACI|nr:MAG: hypothetical protein BAA01_10210 [Bacillus thermozeamaize]